MTTAMDKEIMFSQRCAGHLHTPRKIAGFLITLYPATRFAGPVSEMHRSEGQGGPRSRWSTGFTRQVARLTRTNQQSTLTEEMIIKLAAANRNLF
jgi:serine protease inhibitor ecotin